MSQHQDEDFIGIGDVVEHKMNTNVFGIVIGFAGSIVYLRLSPSLQVASFHEWELQLLDDDGEPLDSKEVEVADNVIQVDFTKARKMNEKTPTKGMA